MPFEKWDKAAGQPSLYSTQTLVDGYVLVKKKKNAALLVWPVSNNYTPTLTLKHATVLAAQVLMEHLVLSGWDVLGLILVAGIGAQAEGLRLLTGFWCQKSFTGSERPRPVDNGLQIRFIENIQTDNLEEC